MKYKIGDLPERRQVGSDAWTMSNLESQIARSSPLKDVTEAIKTNTSSLPVVAQLKWYRGGIMGRAHLRMKRTV